MRRATLRTANPQTDFIFNVFYFASYEINCLQKLNIMLLISFVVKPIIGFKMYINCILGQVKGL